MIFASKVRRLLSITLLMLFVYPAVAPLFALGGNDESQLPACCRRHGKHHCMMSMEEMQALLDGHHFTAVRSKCPLYPKPTVPVSHQKLFFDQGGLVFAEAVSHPAQRRQTEAWARVALEGARYKRGPPVVVL
jgi:hypothetical protein